MLEDSNWCDDEECKKIMKNTHDKGIEGYCNKNIEIAGRV